MSVALVGCGRWGRNILRDLVGLGARVTVIDPSPEARKTALEEGAMRAESGLEHLGAVEGVIVSTPARTHEEVVERLLDRNVPIFCEKPLTVDPRSAARLAARGAGRLFVMDKWRYHPGVEALAGIARAGELGAVLGVRTFRCQSGIPAHDVDGIWTLAPHDLSIVTEVLGKLPRPVAAAVEADGTTALTLDGLLGERPWATIEVSVRAPERRREVRLHCDGGIATLGAADATHVEVASSGREVERRPISAELPLARELVAFLDYLRGEGPPPRSSASEGAETIRVLALLREMGSHPGAREHLRMMYRARGFDATA